MASTRLYTIGFTRKSAADFFGKLQRAGVARVLDVRLNNRSQLAGFAKKEDLRFFLKAIAGIDYFHLPELAPTEELLSAYKKQKGEWSAYAAAFRELIEGRRIEDSTPRELADGGCLLCSEREPDRCHRRVVAEYLAQKWGGVEIVHIV